MDHWVVRNIIIFSSLRPTHEKIYALFELKNLNEQLRGTEREAEGYRERMKDSEFEIQRLRDELNRVYHSFLVKD